MSYVQWTTLWHVVLPGKKITLCGRHVPADQPRREVPPLEMYLCRICGAAV